MDPWTIRGRRTLDVVTGSGAPRLRVRPARRPPLPAGDGRALGGPDEAPAEERGVTGSSLRRHGHPFDLPREPGWLTRLDAIWLRALDREGTGLGPVLVQLFARAPTGTVLRFLDGGAAPTDVLGVVAGLARGPFLRAALRRRPR